MRKSYPPALADKWLKQIESGEMDTYAIMERYGIAASTLGEKLKDAKQRSMKKEIGS